MIPLPSHDNPRDVTFKWLFPRDREAAILVLVPPQPPEPEASESAPTTSTPRTHRVFEHAARGTLANLHPEENAPKESPTDAFWNTLPSLVESPTPKAILNEGRFDPHEADCLNAIAHAIAGNKTFPDDVGLLIKHAYLRKAPPTELNVTDQETISLDGIEAD
jgi:hypothetical protein